MNETRTRTGPTDRTGFYVIASFRFENLLVCRCCLRNGIVFGFKSNGRLFGLINDLINLICDFVFFVLSSSAIFLVV